MELQRILTLTEKAASSYTKYIHKYQLDWEEKEVSIAHETLGTLTIFCHQLKQFIENKDSLDEKSLFLLKDYSYKVENYSQDILNSLGDFIKK